MADELDMQRLHSEQIARSILWWLDGGPDSGGLATDSFLAPKAALAAIKDMIGRYEGLSEWVDAVEKAAAADAAVQVAISVDAPTTVIMNLRTEAQSARASTGRLAGPKADNPENLVRALAALQTLAAQKPEGY